MFSCAPAPTGTPVRVATITINESTFETIVLAELEVAVLVMILERVVAPAEHRFHVHVDSGDIPAAALVKIEVTFYWNKFANASILDLLTTDYPTLVRSLRVLKIARSGFDESAALGAFAALATHLQELTFLRCGLTSLRGLEGRCEYLRKVDLDGCYYLSSIDALSDRVYLEEVTVSATGITTLESLQSCPNLTTVALFGCQELSSIDALAEHQRLQEVNASYSGITTIEPLLSCPNLTTVYLCACRQLLPANVRLPASVNVIRE